MAPKKKEEPKEAPKPKAPEPEPVKIPEFNPAEVVVQKNSYFHFGLRDDGNRENVMSFGCECWMVV